MGHSAAMTLAPRPLRRSAQASLAESPRASCRQLTHIYIYIYIYIDGVCMEFLRGAIRDDRISVFRSGLSAESFIAGAHQIPDRMDEVVAVATDDVIHFRNRHPDKGRNMMAVVEGIF